MALVVWSSTQDSEGELTAARAVARELAGEVVEAEVRLDVAEGAYVDAGFELLEAIERAAPGTYKQALGDYFEDPLGLLGASDETVQELMARAMIVAETCKVEALRAPVATTRAARKQMEEAAAAVASLTRQRDAVQAWVWQHLARSGKRQ